MQVVLQLRDDAEVRRTAEAVVARADAVTPRERAIALRDHLRQTVSYQGAPHDDRPPLRATARETLAGGKGYCGEVTRAFIGLARAVGVPAQRINLYGRVNHVVAVADLGDGGHTLVDCQQPPTIPDLEPLDAALRRPEFDDYSTLNLRRVGLGRAVSRLKLDIGWLTYLTENPHALKAAACLLLAAALWAMYLCRVLFRRLLHRRGWVHRTDSRAFPNSPGGIVPNAGGSPTNSGPVI